MPDIRGCATDSKTRRDIYVDASRILDSCKDKDCFEDSKLLLTDFGQEILDRCSSVRVINTCVLWTDISVDPVKFNRGFYQISIRFFTKVVLEASVGLAKAQEIEGIAVNEKKVVLYGGEGCVNIFKSGEAPGEYYTYGSSGDCYTTSKPQAIVEVTDPIALSVRICDEERRGCGCPCIPEEVPSCVTGLLNGTLALGCANRGIYVSLGYFSVVRVERPAQFVVSATEYSVPDKVCRPVQEDDPCALFAKMSFPTNDFSTDPCKCSSDGCCQ